MEQFLGNRVTLYPGDCFEVLKGIPSNSLDSGCMDPPYALVSIVKRFGAEGAAPSRDGDVYARSSAGFMGKTWDTGEVAFSVEFWTEVFRVLKPGAWLVAFGGTRTYHRLVCPIEDAGFEIRDQLAWAYGTGFPKSLDVSKAIDKAAGAKRRKVGTTIAPRKAMDANPDGGSKYGYGVGEIDVTEPATAEAKEWEGWGTALKPSWEPICLARKPLIGTVVQNVLEHGTGALNIDGCRIHTEGSEGVAYTARRTAPGATQNATGERKFQDDTTYEGMTKDGRWPANIIHDGSDEVVGLFPEQESGGAPARRWSPKTSGVYGVFQGSETESGIGPTAGSAARFFYSAKADAEDRLGSKHPTVKPVDLMQWLCRLITPPGGTVLDCFAGTGTTGEAAYLEGFNAVLIEREPEYQNDIRKRMGLVFASSKARKSQKKPTATPAPGGMFGDD